MGSFRNRLLAVIIGLVCVTQTVTLIAVLARTEHSVQDRAAKQLVAGSAFVQQLVRFRAAQLASGVAVLAADFGFREGGSPPATAPPCSPQPKMMLRESAPISWC